ncbi:MAG: hypothetical protein Q6L60_13335 [Thermostichus sp. HHBFW_bins_43]
MATSKKLPKKKLPTGPTKADLLSRMGVIKSPETSEGAEESSAPLPLPSKPVVSAQPRKPSIALADVTDSEPEDPTPDWDPLPDPPALDLPKPVEVAAAVALPPTHPPPPAPPLESVQPIELKAKLPELAILPTDLPTDFLPPSPARNGNGNGSHTHDAARNGSSNGQVAPPQKAPAAPPPAPHVPEPTPALPDPRDALDAQLGLQKLTLKCSAEMLDKLASLQATTGLPGEILLEVLVDHWEHLPKPLQQDCLMQAHRIRVERLVISQNHAIATIEQLLNEQHLL